MPEQTDKWPTIDQIFPYPKTPKAATAEELARYMALEAHSSVALNAEFLRAAIDAEQSGRDARREQDRYLLNQARMTAEHGVAFLLRELMRHLPDKADGIARRMWEQWDEAPLEAHTWVFVESYDIDPDAVADKARARWRAAQDDATPQRSAPAVHPAPVPLPPEEAS